jgi:hypothetical protein
MREEAPKTPMQCHELLQLQSSAPQLSIDVWNKYDGRKSHRVTI